MEQGYLDIINATIPHSPIQIARKEIEGNPLSIALYNEEILIVGTSMTLNSFNILNQLNSQAMKYFPSITSATKIIVAGNSAYLFSSTVLSVVDLNFLFPNFLPMNL